MSREDIKITVQALLDFIIVAGTTLGGGILESGHAQLPNPAVQLLAVIVGAVAAARRIQVMMEGKPPENLEVTVRQLVAQMRTMQVAVAPVLPDPPPLAGGSKRPPVDPHRAQRKADEAAVAEAMAAVPIPVPVPKPRED